MAFFLQKLCPLIKERFYAPLAYDELEIYSVGFEKSIGKL